jgi:sugar lactone lactonase YvrE
MKHLGPLTLLAVVLGFSTLTNAALVDNGNGLIYDTDLDLTWFDAPPVPRTWGEAKNWASSLTLAGTAKGSWRLPSGVGTASPGAKVFPGQGGEMWHLYFDELHNVVGDQSTKTVPFKNLWPTDPRGYWMGTLIASSGAAWCFWPKDGRIDGIDTGAPKLALAVHSGNVGASGASKLKGLPMSGAFMHATPAKTTSTINYQVITKWGTSGKGNGQFNGPRGIGVDSQGNVYVADMSNFRIQKFTSTGVFLTAWGTAGQGNGQFWLPSGVAVDASGNVYVTDFGNNRVQKFTSTGTFITTWGSFGNSDGQFDHPEGVAVDASGNVYVADRTNCRVQKFTGTGVFIAKRGGMGTGLGAMYYPSSIAVESSANVYVADTNNNRVTKYPSNLNFVFQPWGSYGAGNGQFNYPVGVAVDSSSNVYIADSGNHRIQKFTSNGVFITAWGSKGTGEGQFNNPMAVGVDSSGNVYIADNNNRIQKFGLTPGVASKASVIKKKDISEAKSHTAANKKQDISGAKKYSASAAQKSGLATPNVSGQWKSSIGLLYNITQKGNQFEWTVTKSNEKGQGTLKGNEVSASWSSPQGSGSSTGQISAVDPTGKATQIDWKNGVRFYR